MLPDDWNRTTSPAGPEPLAAQALERPPRPSSGDARLQLLLIFVTLVLVVDALIGERA